MLPGSGRRALPEFGSRGFRARCGACVVRASFFVSGQLVLQDPNDEPAAVLLERIRAEQTARAVGGKKRRPKVTA